MTKIWYTKFMNNLNNWLDIYLSNYFDKNYPVYIKLHFWEPWNMSILRPDEVKIIIDFFKKNWYETILIDTPVAYPSQRNSVNWYMKLIENMWYTKISKCIISDDYIKIKTKSFTSKVCKELYEAENVLILSHVKWHSCSWFGWAIKNLWMWWLMKDTKIVIHDWWKPIFKKECLWCGQCSQLCPAWAIKMIWNKAHIDIMKCRWCSICQNSCPHKCLKPKIWKFDDLLAQWACSLINWFKKQYYINLLIRIAKWCDCEKDNLWIISDDLWILFSDNPIAIDKASLDIINTYNWSNIFKLHNKKDPYDQIEYAKKYCKHNDIYEIYNI